MSSEQTLVDEQGGSLSHLSTGWSNHERNESSSSSLVTNRSSLSPYIPVDADAGRSCTSSSSSTEALPSTIDRAQSSGLNWRYEMRRQCQAMLPDGALYLGPADSGRSLASLHALGITAIVLVRSDIEAPFLKPRFPNQFRYAIFDVGDKFEQNLIRIVPELVHFIEEATVGLGGKVLVHDDNGISRAPALVIMYLMEKFSISYDVAAAHVQGRRYCVHLNEGFVLQCKAYETMIQARMQHNQQQQHQQLNGSMTNQHGVRKRAIEDDDEGNDGSLGPDRTRRPSTQQMLID